MFHTQGVVWGEGFRQVMRSGACAVQQTLTAEAASVLKHSLSLARRRGHAQVTPLHVAATLLSSRASLLRRACLKSQQPHCQSSHPLQCRALELCFNVALNRLPTTPGPLLHGQPSLSNALIAALKRAQAHQRRGCIEQQQQQPLLTIKVELEQLIISILDDPSVSRVMREAGFSSTAVKNNIEDSSASSVFQCYSSAGPGGVYSSPCSPSHQVDQTHHINNFWHTHFLTYSCEQNPVLFSPQKKVFTAESGASFVKEDIKLVFEVFLRNKKRRNTVIVGDSLSATEGLIGELMGRIEKGVDIPEEFKQTRVIQFQFAPVSVRFMKREDVETNISELKKKVDYFLGSGGGAIIYAGDLKWTVQDDKEDGYSPADHLVTEIARLVSDHGSTNISSKPKVWLMGTASYNTYMRCQMRQPSLEIQWGLQAVSVPSGGLGLSLHASRLYIFHLILALYIHQLYYIYISIYICICLYVRVCMCDRNIGVPQHVY